MKLFIRSITLIFSAAFACSGAFADCVVSRQEVLDMLAKQVPIEEIQQRIAGCVATDFEGYDKLFEAYFYNEESQVIKNTGNVDFEAISACGYHPQRKEFTCPIEIRRASGYGGVPNLQPAGSYEYVLICVDSGNGFFPINTNGVHVHDENFGVMPSWFTTAVIPVNGAMFSVPLLGQTLRAKAILSWAVPPASCGATPVWGNQSTFKIRLDP